MKTNHKLALAALTGNAYWRRSAPRFWSRSDWFHSAQCTVLVPMDPWKIGKPTEARARS
jgi:hypothetical protein